MKLFEIKETMPSVKTHSVDDIAKKHKVEASKIEAQLKKGIKIEGEHSKDKDMAREIALDHLLELPDYYDRLDKMENE